MNWIYKNYFGKYRIMLPVDKNTNDFPRDLNGKIEEIDTYIPCKYGEISYYGHGKIIVFVTSKIYKNYVLSEMKDNEGNIIPVYSKRIYSDGTSIVVDGKYTDFFADMLKAKVLGKNVRPSSTKNLPKSDYELSEDKVNEYKKIVSKLDKSNILYIKRFTDNFIDTKLKRKFKIKDISQDIRKKCMSRQKKEYIDSYGMWNDYIKYIKSNLKKEGIEV